MQSFQIRFNVERAHRFASKHDLAELNQMTVLELSSLRLRCRRREIQSLNVRHAQYLGKGFAVRGIDTGERYMRLSAQRPQDVPRRFRVTKGQAQPYY